MLTLNNKEILQVNISYANKSACIQYEFTKSCSLQDYQPLLLSPESTEELVRPGFLAINPQGTHQIERPLNYMKGLLDSTKLVTIDSAIRRRVLIDVQGL